MKKINISIDDVSPHKLSSHKILEKCKKLLLIHPQMKFTLFVPTAYWRTVKTGMIDTTNEKPLFIYEHHDFVDTLKQLPQENFEIAYHGRYHGIPGISNNDEFRYLTADKFEALWSLMKEDMKKAFDNDIKIKNIVRPPAMYMSREALERGSTLDITCFALSKMEHHIKSYEGQHLKLKNVVYANVWPPFNDLNSCKDDKIEILYHACEWDKGYLNDERIDELLYWLKNQTEYEFVFIEDLI